MAFTANEIKLEILDLAGEPINGTSEWDSRIIKFINRAQREIIGGSTVFLNDLGEPWPWAKAQTPQILQLDPPVETGTVALTKGSTAGTFSSPPAASMIGRHLYVSERPEAFVISAHAGGAAPFTLDGAYTDDTTTGNDFKAHRLDYALTGKISRLIQPFNVYRAQFNHTSDLEGKIFGIDAASLAREFPLFRLRRGTPSRFAIIQELDNTIAVRFEASVRTETRVEVDFIPVPVDLTTSPDTTPLLPREDRTFLIHAGAFYLLEEKNDNRQQTQLGFAKSKATAMQNQLRKEFTHTGKNKGALLPRQEQLRKFDVRTSGGLVIK